MQGRAKEILLLALAVGALGLALYTFRGKPAPSPVAEPTPAAPGETGEVAVAEAPEEEATTEGGGDAGAAAAIRNPFSAPGGPEPGSTEEAGEGEAAEVRITEPPPGQEPPTATGFKLEGIMTGPPPFAVIRYGDRPYFPRLGDEVVDGYRVEAIRGEREVVLSGQHGTIVLRTGKAS
ncbi:MAG: hypothetical protein JSV79_13545 [Armatimonadota bacterium]|nr:MAG: hypothetical protein JSV79_13545 [Armatimonadota bacterium]